MTGLELIAKERLRQINEEGWTEEHDDQEHELGAIAMAAACYAAPEPLFAKDVVAASISFTDPWPWSPQWDKRLHYGSNRPREHRYNGEIIYNACPGDTPADPKTYSYKERLDLLAKAGALVAAEIDKLLRLGETGYNIWKERA